MPRPVHRLPLILVSEIPYLWESHRIIRPAFLKTLSQTDCRVRKVWFQQKDIDPDLIREIKNSSCLVFPFSAGESLDLLRKLRSQNEFRRIPVVFCIASQFTNVSSRFLQYRNLFQAGDHFITFCRAEFDLARMFLPRHEGIHRIPLPVLPEDMHPSSAGEKLRFRKSLGLKSREKMIVYAGRLSFQKNIHGLLDAFSAAREKCPHLRLFLLGSPDVIGAPQLGSNYRPGYATELAKKICDLGLTKSVSLVGSLPRNVVREYLASCDLQISLTMETSEDFGYGIVEGMHCGAPTVVTRWGGLADPVDAGAALGVPVAVSRNGPTADIKAAAHAMLSALNPQANRLWRKNAMEYARTYLGQKNIVNRWTEIFQRIATEPHKMSPVSVSREYMEFYLECFETNQWYCQDSSHPFCMKIRNIYARQGHVTRGPVP